MSLEIWWIGKNKSTSEIEDYLKRITRYSKIKVIQLKDSKKKVKEQRIKEEEQMVLQRLKAEDHLVLLDEKGKEFNSLQWSNKLNDSWLRNKRTIFLLGGAYGVGQEIKKSAKETMALSKLTFPHNLARLILIEQLYRAFTIRNNENYHHL